MANRDIIVIGASIGGVQALTQLARGLPAGLPASVFVVCHFPAGTKSVLPAILSRSGPLTATHAIDGEAFEAGHIYIAPPDQHLVLAPEGRLRLNRDARENHHRPAVDPLFRSAARYYGERVIGVILSGGLFDGSAGLMAIRRAGGLAVVQDPSDALVGSMPQSAADIAGADHIVPIAALAALLVDLVEKSVKLKPGGQSMDPTRIDPIEGMTGIVDETMEAQAKNARKGQVAPFTCPECGGALWQVNEPHLIQFRCHVGHAYNGETLLAEQAEKLEAALWTAVRTFREKSVLGRQLAGQEHTKGNPVAAARFEEQAAQSEQYAGLIVKHVLQRTVNGHEGGGTP